MRSAATLARAKEDERRDSAFMGLYRFVTYAKNTTTSPVVSTPASTRVAPYHMTIASPRAARKSTCGATRA
jgi:hypothetical protein